MAAIAATDPNGNSGIPPPLLVDELDGGVVLEDGIEEVPDDEGVVELLVGEEELVVVGEELVVVVELDELELVSEELLVLLVLDEEEVEVALMTTTVPFIYW